MSAEATTVIPVGGDYDVLVGHGVSHEVVDLVPAGARRALVVLSLIHISEPTRRS